jgi:hypothetical protein
VPPSINTASPILKGAAAERPWTSEIQCIGDWNQFLEVQEELLLRIMGIVQQSGAGIAFPLQPMYFATDSYDKATRSAPALNLDGTPLADFNNPSRGVEGNTLNQASTSLLKGGSAWVCKSYALAAVPLGA